MAGAVVFAPWPETCCQAWPYRKANHALDSRSDLVGPLGVGLVQSHTLGGFIHVLLILAVVTVLIRVIKGRRVLP